MGKRILIVDDDGIILSVMSEMLACIGGYEVVARPNGTEGLLAFSEDPSGFDLLITDHYMDGITGLELAKEALKRRSDLPVIFLSGSDCGLKTEAPRGRTSLVRKPITIDQLLPLIEQMLSPNIPAA